MNTKYMGYFIAEQVYELFADGQKIQTGREKMKWRYQQLCQVQI